MLKLTIAVLAVALAGTANAAGWRSLRVDGSSEASFAASVEEFGETLSPARYRVFVLALKDIWEQGTASAVARQGEYTRDDYLRELDGLGYEQVVNLTDPSGDTAKMRLRSATARAYGPRRPASGSVPVGSAWPQPERTFPAKDPAGNPNGIVWGGVGSQNGQ